MTEPLVSVCIPTYGRARIIAQTIRSALSQTHSNIEVVLSDNCSTDDTLAIARRISDQDERLIVLESPKNYGAAANWKKCLDHANGDFVRFLFSDDYMAPECIAESLLHFGTADAFVCNASKYFEHDLSTLSQSTLYYREESKRYPTSTYIADMILTDGFPYSPSAGMFRRRDASDVLLQAIPNEFGLCHADTAAGLDSLMFLLLCVKYPTFSYINTPLTYFGTANASITLDRGEDLVPYYATAYDFFIRNHALEISGRYKALLRHQREQVVTKDHNRRIIHQLESALPGRLNRRQYLRYGRQPFFKRLLDLMLVR